MRDYKAAGNRYHTRGESRSHRVVPKRFAWSAMTLAALIAAALVGWRFFNPQDASHSGEATQPTDGNAIPLALPPAGATAIGTAGSPVETEATNPR